SVCSASTLTRVIGASGQYSSGSRVVTRMISPFFASSSTVAFVHRQRSVPVSFSFPIVWSAPLSEKNVVSPEKKAPLSGIFSSSCVSANEALGVDSETAGSDGGQAVETGALHQASLVAPAAAAISEVSATLDGASAFVSFQAGSSTIGSGSGHTGSFEV